MSFYDNTVHQYSLTGTEINSFSSPGTLAALAYEQSTDTLWAFNRDNGNVEQYSTTGTHLQSFAVQNLMGNIYGGEMPILATSVPEPETYALMLIGLAGVGAAARRQRKAA